VPVMRHPVIGIMWVILVKLITHILLPDIERTQHTHYAAGRNYPMSAAVLLRTGPQPAAAGCGAVTGGLDRDRHMAQTTIVSGQGKEEHPDRRHGQQVEPSQKPGERPREWHRARARGPPQRVPNDQRQQKRGAEDDGGAQPVHTY
jgi:hypothetical protein